MKMTLLCFENKEHRADGYHYFAASDTRDDCYELLCVFPTVSKFQ